MRIAILNDRSTLNHPFGRLLYESLLEDGHVVILASADEVNGEIFYNFSKSRAKISSFVQKRLPKYQIVIEKLRLKNKKVAILFVSVIRILRKLDKAFTIHFLHRASLNIAYLRSGLKVVKLDADIAIISRPQTVVAQTVLLFRNLFTSRKLKIVYYPYEIYGHQYHNHKYIVLLLERYLIKHHYDAIIAPSSARLAYYRGIKPSLIGCVARNFKHFRPLERHYLPTTSKLNLVYLGLIDYGRNIEKILSNLEDMPIDFTLTLIGKRRKKWESENLENLNYFVSTSRLVLVDEIPEVLIPETLQRFDLGLISYEGNALNNRLCAPAKITDYLHSDLPVVGPDFIGMRELENLNHNIHLYNANDVGDLFRLLEALAPKLRDLEPGVVSNDARELNWANEYKKIIELLNLL